MDTACDLENIGLPGLGKSLAVAQASGTQIPEYALGGTV